MAENSYLSKYMFEKKASSFKSWHNLWFIVGDKYAKIYIMTVSNNITLSEPSYNIVTIDFKFLTWKVTFLEQELSRVFKNVVLTPTNRSIR
jgi:hypothetical protein